MCDHMRYTVDAHEQTGHCHDCGAEGRMVFVVGGREYIKKLQSALADACDCVESLGGRDNSCDPSPDEDVAEWRTLLPNDQVSGRAA